MIRLPVVEAKPTGWRAWLKGPTQIPISALAFFLALLLVTALAALAGGVLGVALPLPEAGSLLGRNADGRADRPAIGPEGFSQGFNAHGWERVKVHPGQHSTSE